MNINYVYALNMNVCIYTQNIVSLHIRDAKTVAITDFPILFCQKCRVK